jgi:putative ABC transport system permease protein
MLKNYFKIALRNLLKNKVFSLINIFGLAVGLTCCMLIAAFLYTELGYDKFAEHADQIYRVGLKISQNGGVADYPDVDAAVGEGIKNALPGISQSARITSARLLFMQHNDKNFKENLITFCDSNFLQMFSIPLIEGDNKKALVAPYSIVITKALAKKYFGGESALGKALLIGGKTPLKVTGVIDKIPENAHFHFDGFISMTTDNYTIQSHTWSNIGYYTYLQLSQETDPHKIEAKFPELIAKYVTPEAQHDMGISLAEAQKTVSSWHFYLMPVADIHLRSHTKYELEANSDIQYIYIFGALAVFILLLACVNFTNLSTANSFKRSREVGIRKVLGSLKNQLISQFLTESVLLACGAMLLALIFVYFLLPSFNYLSGKNISIIFFLQIKAFIFAVALILIVGIIAGIYPAFFLSSFQIINVLKGGITSSPIKKGNLRSGLVVFQFMISTSLIIATLIVYLQLHFMQNKNLGYDRDQVIVLQDTFGLDSNQYSFRQKLLQDSRVINATISRDVPVGRGENDMDGSEVYAKENKANETASEIHANFFHVDYDYLSTLGMKIVAGRNFLKDFHGDSSAVVINEAAVRDLGWKNQEDALNKTIVKSGRREIHVIGVVKDFNYASVKQKIAPVLMMLGHNSGSILVKIKTTDVAGFLADTKKDWEGFSARTPFSFYFLDDKFGSLYAAEQRTGQIFTMFSIIALSIASLGLFGLVGFTTEQRTKEIGIRKVLGASVNQVLFLLSKEFLYLVCIAFVISIPLTWWVMHSWLENFAYRITIGWWIFLIGGLASILIAFLTVSLQAIKAAIANPIRSLRTE